MPASGELVERLHFRSVGLSTGSTYQGVIGQGTAHVYEWEFRTRERSPSPPGSMALLARRSRQLPSC